MIEYRDTLTLDPQTTTLSMVEEVEEKLREWAAPKVITGSGVITFAVAAPDLWDLHEMLSEIEQYLGSIGVDWAPDKAKVA